MRETIPSLNREVSLAIAVAMLTRNDTLFGSVKFPMDTGPGGGGGGFGFGA